MTKLNFDLIPIGAPAANDRGRADSPSSVVLIGGTALLIWMFAALMRGAI